MVLPRLLQRIVKGGDGGRGVGERRKKGEEREEVKRGQEVELKNKFKQNR